MTGVSANQEARKELEIKFQWFEIGPENSLTQIFPNLLLNSLPTLNSLLGATNLAN